MKKNHTNRLFAMLLLAMFCMASCSDMTSEESRVEEEYYTLTVLCTKAEPATKALSFGSQGVLTTWTAGDKVTVSKKNAQGEYVKLDGALEAQSNDSKTLFTGQLKDNLQVGDELLLEYESPAYDKQEGSLDYIAKHCDYALATIRVSAANPSTRAAETDAAEFTSQQAIVLFKLQAKDESSVEAETFTLSYGGSKIVVTPKTATDELYVAIPAISSAMLSLAAETLSEGNYAYSKSGVSFDKEKYYQVKVKMEQRPEVGGLFYSDGSWGTHNPHDANRQPIGIVVYLGDDAVSENMGHGLVMALKNSATDIIWSKNSEGWQFPESEAVTCPNEALVDYGGYAKTQATSQFPAAASALGYQPAAPSNGKTTSWFIPAVGQWLAVVGPQGIGRGYAPSKWKNGNNKEWLGPNGQLSDVIRVEAEGVTLSRINGALAKAGAGNYEEIEERNYWTSSENSNNRAIRMNFGHDKGFSHCKVKNEKKEEKYAVRPFLAF